MLIVPVSVAGEPIIGFTVNDTEGLAPLPVQFTDKTTGVPFGWAWFFGDESFCQPWTKKTAGAGWAGRHWFSSVGLPDGSIVLTGGGDDYDVFNDAWRSTDKGATWTLMNASSGWQARDGHTSVVLSDGSIVLMGGKKHYTGVMNDTWRSVDKGATWTRMVKNAQWPARVFHSSVVLSDDSIVLMGGYDGSSFAMNDTWRSVDKGATWTRMNASSGWSARYLFSTVALPDDSIVLMGGPGKNDTWRSTNMGATWTRRNASSGWLERDSFSSVALPDYSIVLMGGRALSVTMDYADVWRSADSGMSWTRVNASAGWKARSGHSGVLLRDGSIVIMGGWNRTGDGQKEFNDTWRFQPAGSTSQNPVHTYTVPGLYKPALLAHNVGAFNSTRMSGVIRAIAPPTWSKVGVFRPSIHQFRLKLDGGTTVITFGQSTDTPVAGDWDGDDLDDVGVHRPALKKFVLRNGTETTIVKWGVASDTGVAGDWNGDGMGDIGVFRSSLQKFVLKNGTEKTTVKWGLATDTPVSGDWNGDGLWDVGVYRSSDLKFILKNGTEKTQVSWGQSGDIPVAGDWNGDGLWDIGVFRPSAGKFILKNGTEMKKITFGASTDIPVTGKWS